MSTTVLASVLVLVTGIFWGIYWLPVRAIAELGLDGAWGTGAITLAGAIFLFPFMLANKKSIRDANFAGIASIALGGAAFAFYSIGFLYGKVALVVLLWFFSPVWSVLIAKYLLRWYVPKLRLIAIFVGLAGLFIMLGSDRKIPIPVNLGEWLAFFGGFIWAIAMAGMRLKSIVPPGPAAFVFAIGATITSFILAPFLEPAPTIAVSDLTILTVYVLLTGGIWWGASIATLMWAAVRLDPARVGILLMTEVIFGALTAALFAGENLSFSEMIGGFLVILCGLLEVWPTKMEIRRSHV
jgi:drug/metabolite transporter (DMT)-like permease